MQEKDNLSYNGRPIRLSLHFSAEILKAMREQVDILKVMIERNFQPRMPYPAQLSFRNDEIKTFSNK